MLGKKDGNIIRFFLDPGRYARELCAELQGSHSGLEEELWGQYFQDKNNEEEQQPVRLCPND